MPLPLPQFSREAPSLLAKPRRENGAAFIAGPDGTRDYATVMCVHCQAHWRYIPGSGAERGFCMRCMGPTCGRERCDPCVPFEKMIEAMEARARFLRQLDRLD